MRPKSELAHNNWGVALAQKGDLDRARSQYERALEIVPDYTEARLNLALVHLDLGLAHRARGDLDLAIESFQRALRLDASLTEARNNLLRAEDLRAPAG